MTPRRIALVAAAAVAAYVAACVLQIWQIQSAAGLAVSLSDVVVFTLSLYVEGGLWVPFLQTPPRHAS